MIPNRNRVRRVWRGMLMVMGALLMPIDAFAHPPRLWIEREGQEFFFWGGPMSSAGVTNGKERAEWGTWGPDLRPLVADDPRVWEVAEEAFSHRRNAKIAYYASLAALLGGYVGGLALMSTGNELPGTGALIGGLTVGLGASLFGLSEQGKTLQHTFRIINDYNRAEPLHLPDE